MINWKGLVFLYGMIIFGTAAGVILAPYYGEWSFAIFMFGGAIIGLFGDHAIKRRDMLASAKRQYKKRLKHPKAFPKIKPCPKCGSNYIVALGQSRHYDLLDHDQTNHKLQCVECGHQSLIFYTYEEARKDWNKGRRRKK